MTTGLCSTAAHSDLARIRRSVRSTWWRPLSVALVLTSSLLAACGGGNDESAPTDAKAAQMRCAP